MLDTKMPVRSDEPFETEDNSLQESKKSVLKRLLTRNPLLLVIVVLPTMLAVLYFGLFANDVYVSESRFVVRSPSKSSISPLGMVLSGGGLTGASEESNAVTEYLQSRRALADADRDGLVRRAYGDTGVFWYDRFGGLSGTSREQLYRYFLTKIGVEEGTTTQVTTLTVEAFDPESAQRINARLLERSEALVNSLSERARADSVAIAAAEVDEAKTVARNAAVALARFRNEQGIIDPELQATTTLQMISKLQDELIMARAQLQQMETYTPQASQIPFLRSQIRSLEGEIARQTSSIAGGNHSLSTAAIRYQELQLDSEFGEKQLAAVLASLQEARSEARRKRAYIERIADPSLPDYAVEPRRTRGIVATFLLGLLAWGVLSMLMIGIREHRD